jgi:hypothetical protein
MHRSHGHPNQHTRYKRETSPNKNTTLPSQLETALGADGTATAVVEVLAERATVGEAVVDVFRYITTTSNVGRYITHASDAVEISIDRRRKRSICDVTALVAGGSGSHQKKHQAGPK